MAPAAEGKQKKSFAFIGEMISEFKKVVWPSRRELVRLTLIVIAITVALGLILGGIDFVFTRLITLLGGS
ncbi:MAG: preprotein translocase subunit SecE [Chloroflexi bacterium]|nr:preprotein translocase subunit SecE [Chloroflexota bacterium]